MQPLQQQHCDQGCPNLDAQRVLTSPYEGLDLEVLLQRLEEEFDLPTLLVDLCDRRGPEVSCPKCPQPDRPDFEVRFGRFHGSPTVESENFATLYVA